MTVVLVTGGTGYVAGWCIADLLTRGHTVRTTVRSLTREAPLRAAIPAGVDPADRLSCAVADQTPPDGSSSRAARP